MGRAHCFIVAWGCHPLRDTVRWRTGGRTFCDVWAHDKPDRLAAAVLARFQSFPPVQGRPPADYLEAGCLVAVGCLLTNSCACEINLRVVTGVLTDQGPLYIKA